MKKTRIIIIFAAFCFFIFGVVDALFKPEGIRFIHMILNAFLAFIWCKTHAVEHNKKIGFIYLVFVLVFPVIGISIYLFKFFGFKLGSQKILQVILFYILCLLLYLSPIYYL